MIKLLKYTTPSHYDLWPEGSQWQDGDNLYIQVSNNPESAQWLPMGKFLEGAFEHILHDDKFMTECMKLYKQSGERPMPKSITDMCS